MYQGLVIKYFMMKTGFKMNAYTNNTKWNVYFGTVCIDIHFEVIV